MELPLSKPVKKQQDGPSLSGPRADVLKEEIYA